jgi:hypothetical protein
MPENCRSIHRKFATSRQIVKRQNTEKQIFEPIFCRHFKKAERQLAEMPSWRTLNSQTFLITGSIIGTIY